MRGRRRRPGRLGRLDGRRRARRRLPRAHRQRRGRERGGRALRCRRLCCSEPLQRGRGSRSFTVGACHRWQGKAQRAAERTPQGEHARRITAGRSASARERRLVLGLQSGKCEGKEVGSSSVPFPPTHRNERRCEQQCVRHVCPGSCRASLHTLWRHRKQKTRTPCCRNCTVHKIVRVRIRRQDTPLGTQY